MTTSATVEHNALCRNCGQPLLGLVTSGFCPRCGFPVAASLRGDLLCLADPAWLRTLRRGAMLAFWSAVISPIVMIIAIIAGRVVGPAAFALVVLWDVAALAGSFLLCTPEPRTSNASVFRLRTLQWLLVVTGLSSVMTLVAGFPIPIAAKAVLLLVGFVCDSVGVAATFLLLRYLGELMLRVPDYPAAKRIAWLAPTTTVVLGVFVVVNIVQELVALDNPDPRHLGPIACVGVLLLLPLLALSILLLMWLWRFASHLSRAVNGKP